MKTKLIHVRLAAYTRVEWNGDVLLDYPDEYDFDKGDSELVADLVGALVDGGDFEGDPHYWEAEEVVVDDELGSGVKFAATLNPETEDWSVREVER